MRPITIHQPAKLSFGTGCLRDLIDDITVAGIQRIFLVTFTEILPVLADFTDKLLATVVKLEIDSSIRTEPTQADFHRILDSAFRDGKNIEARSDLALGSLYGGMCLGPVNTTAIHALSYPLGSKYHVPHGLSNAMLLPHVMEFNLAVAADRYAEVAEIIGVAGEGSVQHKASSAVEAMRDLMDRCTVPSRLSELNIPEDSIPTMAESAMKVQRLLINNPREVSKEDAIEIYHNAY
jgi:alcohol dehydrogenase class IV